MPDWTNEQLDAIKKSGKNIIVSAGAGSGKTAVLTARVIEKIENGININELLILTFTNAAAKEMKDRIRKELIEKKLKSQLDLIDGAFITTFDSFALSLVKKYHYLLNISPDVKIADASLIMLEKEKILDSIFNEMYQNKNSLFLKLINDLCIKDDEDIRKYILNIDDKLNLKINKIDYLKSLVDETFNSKFIDSKIEEYINLIYEKINDIKNKLEEISYIADGNYFEKLSDSLTNLLNSKNYDEIKNNISLKLPPLPKNSDEELKNLKEELSENIKTVKQLCTYSTICEIRDNILLTCDYVTIILEIIISLENKITEYKLKNELFEFNDIIKMSINVIQNNKSVKEELKYTFKEIMVDEYQDTSDLQELFINLIQNNNVYMVGDIKQSIYRFRNANPTIFKDKYDKYSREENGIKIDLNKNFRSRDEVLKNINLIFNYIMDSNIGGADYETSHQMIFGNDSYEKNKPTQNYNMEFMYYDYNKDNNYTKEEIEYFTICTDIIEKIKNGYLVYDKDLKKHRPCRYSDFSILIDRSTSFELGKKIFEYMHIPLSIYKDESINESYDFSLIKNILKLILKEKNREYDTNYKYLFVSIARSYLFRYSDEKIFKIIKDNKIKEDIIIDKIRKLSADVYNISISNLLYSLLNEFSFYEKITTVGNVSDSLARFEYLNNLFLSLEEIGYTLGDMVDYLSSITEKNYEITLAEAKSSTNSVKIMTIHKSKGLEYPICYFIGLDKKFNISDIKDKIIYSDKYGIITPYVKNGIGKTIYIDLLKNDYLIEEVSEKIRLFYVALTRAREKMIFVVPQNNKNKQFKLINRKNYRSFADIIYSLSEYLDKYIKIVNLDNINLSKKYNKFSKQELNIVTNSEKIEFKEFRQDHDIINESKYSKQTNEIINKDTEKNIELGLLFHEYLEYLDFKNPNLEKIDDEFIKNKIIKLLNKLSLEETEIYKETEFMYEEDNIIHHGIIDLMIEHNNYIDIIDYKLKNIVDDNYKKQLNGYKEYISKIKNKTINIYLYSIIDEELKKIDI